MAELTSLAEAVAELVHDGDTVALEGFTHLIPYAAGHEIIRQGRRDLTLVRMTPDLIYDQMIGAGVRRASWSSPGAATPASARCTGSATRSRTAGRAPLEVEEHSHAGMANRVRRRRRPGCRSRCCAATRAPTSPSAATPSRTVTCPFTGEQLAAVRRAQPRRHRDPRAAGRPVGQRAAVGHRRRAEGGGAGRAALDRHRRGDRRRAGPAPGAVVLPGWVVTAVCARARRRASRPTPRATPPATTTSTRPGTPISRDRDTFTAWMAEHVLDARRRRRDRRTARLTTRGRDDDGRPRLARCATAQDLLRRHRAAQHGGQPRPPHARPRGWC